MLDGGPIVADFSDVRVKKGAVYVDDHVLDITELALFLNKIEKADTIKISQEVLEEFLDIFPAAFDKKDIIIDE